MYDRETARWRLVRVAEALVVAVVAACSSGSGTTTAPAVPAAPPASPPPQDTAPTAQIAFVGPKVGHDRQIFLMNADGSGVIALTTGGGEHTDPAWSPDGARLAFANVTTGGIYVVNADGSRLRRLTATGENPTWSPDGSAIAFSAPDSTGANALPTKRIALISPDAPGLTWISPAEPLGHSDIMPAWSPDGRRIAYVRGGLDDVPSLIYLAWLDGLGGSTPITFLPPGTLCAASAPAWSPDGKSLLFWSLCAAGIAGSDGGGFAIGNSDGSGSMRPITSGVEETYDSEPDWSKDGGWVVFSTTGIGSDDAAIYVMRSDGSRATRLAAGIKPAWRPRTAP